MAAFQKTKSASLATRFGLSSSIGAAFVSHASLLYLATLPRITSLISHWKEIVYDTHQPTACAPRIKDGSLITGAVCIVGDTPLSFLLNCSQCAKCACPKRTPFSVQLNCISYRIIPYHAAKQFIVLCTARRYASVRAKKNISSFCTINDNNAWSVGKERDTSQCRAE